MSALLNVIMKSISRRRERLLDEERTTLEAIKSGSGFVDDHVAARLVNKGCVNAEWHEGMGAGYYTYFATGKQP